MALRRDGERTKAILLHTAAKVFAKYGYQDATNELICKPSGLNPASVSYYFKGKANLYREAWLFAHEEGSLEFPMDGGVPHDAPPEDRLMGRIRTMVYLASDPRYCCGQMILREMANPTGLLKDLWDAHVLRARRMLDDIIDKLLGGLAGRREIMMHAINISSMCRIFLYVEPGRVHVEDQEFSMDEMVEQIHRFAILSLKSRREELEQGLT